MSEEDFDFPVDKINVVTHGNHTHPDWMQCPECEEPVRRFTYTQDREHLVGECGCQFPNTHDGLLQGARHVHR